MKQHPQIGDRVILTQPFIGLIAGTSGIVTAIYPTAPNFCDVQFQEGRSAVLVHRKWLRVIAATPQPHPA